MTLLSYQVFMAVVEQESFQKAAQILQLTPSAISHAVASMEAELGSALFVRSRQGVYLTNYGKELFPYIKNVLNSDEYLQQAIAQFQGVQKGVVRIGIFNSACVEWMPSLLKDFEKEYPNVRLHIYQGTYDDIYHWLKDGVVDLGFLSSCSVGDLAYEPIYQDRIVCVVPKGFQPENPGYVTVDELKKQRFVTQREGCDADVNHFMKKYGLSAGGRSYIVDDMSAIALVMGGYGVCLVPELVIRNISFPIDVYPLDVEEKRTIVLASVRSDILAPAVQRMYDYIIKRFKDGIDRMEF
ncbi:MAG: LysR family transcriptional regulator [Lachnospiraceae bacterium]|nr:LysR family transcriptional regulator [Lachnospiraceae bacterium]